MSSRLSSGKKKEPSIIDVWLSDEHCHGCAIDKLVKEYPPPYRVFSRALDWWKFKKIIAKYDYDISLEPLNKWLWLWWNKRHPIQATTIGKVFMKFVETVNKD